MQIGPAVIIVDVEHLYALSHDSHVSHKVDTQQIGMSRIEAEAEHFAAVSLIDPVYTLRSEIRIGAGSFCHMPRSPLIEILHADHYILLLRDRQDRVEKLLRPLPLSLLAPQIPAKLQPVYHDVGALKISTYLHTLGSDFIPQMVVYLLCISRDIDGIGHMHLVYPDTCCFRPLFMRPEIVP